MIKITDKTKCCGCSACKKICPVNCIEMLSDDFGCLYPEADKTKCIGCKKCDLICPVLNPPEPHLNQTPDTYAAYIKDGKIRLKSSSGGMFYALSQAVFENGGIVFGAAFDDKMILRHRRANNTAELLPLLGSKYIQSDISDSLIEIKALLNSNNKVLFCGTPCQCAAVKKLCECDNLITVSFICHGVPSTLLWHEYLKRCSQNSLLTACNMRDKKSGWVNYSITTKCADGSFNSTWHEKNEYFAAYMSGKCLRPSCGECRFKGINNPADIILGDFWNGERILKGFTDYTGTSTVIIQSKKGGDLFDKTKPLIEYEKISYSDIANTNKMLIKSAEVSQIKFDADKLLDEYKKVRILPQKSAAKLFNDIKFWRDKRKIRKK